MSNRGPRWASVFVHGPRFSRPVQEWQSRCVHVGQIFNYHQGGSYPLLPLLSPCHYTFRLLTLLSWSENLPAICAHIFSISSAALRPTMNDHGGIIRRGTTLGRITTVFARVVVSRREFDKFYTSKRINEAIFVSQLRGNKSQVNRFFPLRLRTSSSTVCFHSTRGISSRFISTGM